MRPPASQHLRGLGLAASGALCLVPDSTLIRLVDADDSQIIFFRPLFVGIALALLTMGRHRGGAWRAYGAIGARGRIVALAWAVSLVLFPVSVNHTAVANTLVILATAPFFAALATRLLLGERIGGRTWVAMAVAFAGVAITFAGRSEVGGLAGNLAALGVAVALGVNLTVIRGSGGVDMVPAISLAGFIAAAIVLPFAWPVGMSARDLGLVAVMGLVLVPAAFTLLAWGTRYLPAPEVTLLMLLETALGPLLVWAVIGEAPPTAAFVGGAVVMAALTTHSVVALRHEPGQPAGEGTAAGLAARQAAGTASGRGS